MDFAGSIKTALKKELNVEAVLEVPHSAELGDFAFPCFFLAKTMKKSPVEIAKWLEARIKVDGVRVRADGAYLNFFVDNESFSEKILKEAFSAGFGCRKKSGRKVVVEFPGPNTNKPLHLGHVRNICLGHSFCLLGEANGDIMIPVNINNDRGVHICKSMLAYQKWGVGDSPEKSGVKSDFFVGKYYVMFSKAAADNPELENEALAMLKKWESGDKVVIALWKKMNKWALDGFKKTYKSFGIKFVKEYYESRTYKAGKKLVLEGLKKNIFRRNEKGAVVFGMGDGAEKVLLREDGTSVYITQDMYLAKLRYDDFKFDKLVYVVATEQNFHFRVLFEVLKALGFPFAEKCRHFAYGMVNLTTGRMKSREGTVVDADTLVADIEKLAFSETKARHPELSDKKVSERARVIAMGAVRFYILKNDPVKDMLFDSKQSISLEGGTGPYVQYAHARCCSILRKYGKKISDNVDFGLLSNSAEISLVKLLGEFPVVVERSYSMYRQSLLANYLLSLAQEFSNFYSQCQVVSEDECLTRVRALVVDCTRNVLSRGLGLLGIESPEEM
jgi:arginyl-tRNA synthetase